MNIDIVGPEWDESSLQQMPELKQQILDDLKKKIDRDYFDTEVGDVFLISRRDGIKGFYQFLVVEDVPGEMILNYMGWIA